MARPTHQFVRQTVGAGHFWLKWKYNTVAPKHDAAFRGDAVAVQSCFATRKTGSYLAAAARDVTALVVVRARRLRLPGLDTNFRRLYDMAKKGPPHKQTLSVLYPALAIGWASL